MISRKTLALLLTGAMLVGCSPGGKDAKSSLIPIPKEMKLTNGAITLSSSSGIYVNNESIDKIADLLITRLSSSKAVDHGKKQEINLLLIDNSSMNKEGYRMNITNDGVNIEATTTHGIFYGVQSLLQLIEQNENGKNEFTLPTLSINDEPRFKYRGMHYDVSRNFFSVDFTKKYIDLLATYKFNTLHWHLTDGAGWRIEIKKYPLLTQKTAFRNQKTWKEFWNEGGRKFANEGDENVTGGYYTQEEIKDVVAYAQERFITIIPEIEMPGHSEEVFVAYPHLSCSNKPYVDSDFCAGNDEVFAFIDDVLTEVIALFPSEYIHIGGDEAGKGAWKKCPLCQKRIRDNKLKDVDELQSYFVKRVEKIVESKGRKIIGWDEIIEGGLAPAATVMSWRGEEGGIKAAKDGHDIIMTPGSHCYFDAYQSNPTTEPEAISGYLPLRKVYSYEPMPKELPAEFQHHLLGIQACMWAEHIPTEEHFEYMLLPRMLALAEVAWSPSANKDWEGFKHRIFDHFPTLEKKGYNYHRPTYEMDMVMNVDQTKKEIAVKLENEQDNPIIRYTTDGSVPTNESEQYKDSIVITGNKNLKAAIFVDGQLKEPMLDKPINYHKAVGAKVEYKTKWTSYPGGGESGLVDGYRGGMGYGDGLWQGFIKDMDIVIDLGEVKPIENISATFMQLIGPGVYMPTYIEVKTSVDGKMYVDGFKVENDVDPKRSELIFKDYKGELGGKEVRYIHLFVKNQNGFTFTDEIIVN